jgi:hypothetical protein
LAAAAFYPEVDRSVVSLLSKAGWSLGCVSAIDSNGRTIWIADARRDRNHRFIVRADEKLAAFVELESAIRAKDVNQKANHHAGQRLAAAHG